MYKIKKYPFYSVNREEKQFNIKKENIYTKMYPIEQTIKKEMAYSIGYIFVYNKGK